MRVIYTIDSNSMEFQKNPKPSGNFPLGIQAITLLKSVWMLRRWDTLPAAAGTWQRPERHPSFRHLGALESKPPFLPRLIRIQLCSLSYYHSLSSMAWPYEPIIWESLQDSPNSPTMS